MHGVRGDRPGSWEMLGGYGRTEGRVLGCLQLWFNERGLSSCRLPPCPVETDSKHQESFLFLLVCMGVLPHIHLPLVAKDRYCLGSFSFRGIVIWVVFYGHAWSAWILWDMGCVRDGVSSGAEEVESGSPLVSKIILLLLCPPFLFLLYAAPICT